MTNTIEVKKDLLKVFSLMLFIGIILVVLKMYDARTNEIGKIGEKLLIKYIN